MMIDNAELNILRLLASQKEVNWTWYNLDRAMARRNMEGVGNVARLVHHLYEAGLVDIIPANTPGMDYYSVSESGIKYLAALHQQNAAPNN
ncbi:hypothetical protein ACU9D5_000720 [Cronobacter dublinensis]|jgi:DNA-binding PadR family transcriptional regulator|uniref:hypothetical protein n=1 Tax=Cronobacter dublinensis TaxID=413497 RepID=UPI001AA0CFDC|nr:hypothetical protein [Cronobacter dublinensis]EGT4359828.1 hypothetical protein [Cronobacter dublinensis]MDI6476902.1 hypothetical protein [Cronobacter dublinensis]